MKSALVIIGENIKYNEILVEYIKREANDFLKKIDFYYMLEGSDKNLFLFVEDILEKCSNIIIATDEKNFNITGKIIATLHSDTLVLKNDMLLPSNSSVFDENSYLFETDNYKINVIKVKEEEKLPKFLIKENNSVKFINIFDMDEESCEILLAPIAENYEIKIKIIKVIDGWNLVKLESLKYGQINNFIDSVIQLLPDKVIPQKDIFSHITFKLIENDIKIATAESCTGGLLSATLIKYSGVSGIINGNLVTYANDIKEAWLGVNPQTLENYGAVSEECVHEMLEGALNVSNSDISVAISGVAGPTGGTKEKPVGTVYIGVKSKNDAEIIKRVHLKGDRVYIQNQAVLYAAKMLLELEKNIFFQN